MNKKDFISKERARASAFNLFSALLCQPEEDLITDTNIFDALEQSLKVVNHDCIENVSEMKKVVKKYTSLELLIEYTRLFLGPFKVLVHPYSSLYFGTEKRLMSDETMWVMNFYSDLGLEFKHEKIKDLPDHVAVETEFMYYLIFNEINLLDKGKRKKSYTFWKNQTEFFNKHYKKWVPEFCKKVSDETNNEYYKSLSECLGKFVLCVAIPEFPDNRKQ